MRRGDSERVPRCGRRGPRGCLHAIGDPARSLARAGHLILALGVAIISLATPEQAVAGASILEPAPTGPRAPLTGMNFGFWASSSQPIGKSRDFFDRSFKGGVALTWIQGRSSGVGVTVDYTRWRSTVGGAEWDRLFSIFSGTEIRGTEVTASGVRASFRFTQWLAAEAPISPWVQAGVGLCRLNRKTVFPVDQLINSGWQVNARGAIDTSYQPFLVGGVGFDLVTLPNMRVGFDVMGEVILLMNKDDVEDEPITALTIGGHVLFGRWGGR